MQAVAERCNYHSVEDLLAGLGYGEVTLNLVLNRWREVVKAQQPIATDSEVPLYRQLPHECCAKSPTYLALR